jgi:hypothetical protein
MTSANSDTTVPARAQESLLDEVFFDLVSSGEFLSVACEVVGWKVRTFYARRYADAEFGKRVDAAVEVGLDARADRTALIARGDKAAGSSGDWKRDQLIVKQENWLLSKRSGRYADKLQVDQRSGPLPPPAFSDDPNEAARQYQEWVKSGAC